MNEALEIIYQIYFAFIDWIFNRANFISGVSIGWVAVTVFVFSILINNILNVAKTGQRVRIGRRDD